jgi:hypothetical protein
MLSRLILVREDILQLRLQPDQDGFEFIKRKMVLTSFDSLERGVRHANFLREIRVGKAASRLSQIPRKLSVEVPLHLGKLAKLS